MAEFPKIFIAYSRRDEDLLEELRMHLNPLERSKKVQIWYDGKIEPGTVWEANIKKHLHEADIILLLVSAASIASDYFYDREVKDALERHEKGTAKVVPLILRPCAWKTTPLATLQALPKDGIPLTQWASRDAAYNDAVTRIWKLVQGIEEKRKQEVLRPLGEIRSDSEKDIEKIKRRVINAGLALLITSSIGIALFYKYLYESRGLSPRQLQILEAHARAKDSLRRDSIFLMHLDKAERFVNNEEFYAATMYLDSASSFAVSEFDEYYIRRMKQRYDQLKFIKNSADDIKYRSFLDSLKEESKRLRSRRSSDYN